MEKRGNPVFSVVVTCHNKGAFIKKTLGSVLGQSFKDFEVIVVDHGSTDNTKDIVGSFSDPRIRYFYKENCGLPACSRNRGMERAGGNYIALLDGDDWWHEDKLKICKEVLDANPDVSLVCHNLAIMRGGRQISQTSYQSPAEGQIMYEKLLFEGCGLNPSAVVIRREVFSKDGFGFSEERSIFVVEDYEYWIRLSQHYKFLFLPDILGYYTATDTGAFLGNIEANTVNTIALLKEHFAALAQDKTMSGRMKKRLSAVMAGAGRLYIHKKDFKKSLEWYGRAIREFPANYKAYVGFLASFFRIRIRYK